MPRAGGRAADAEDADWLEPNLAPGFTPSSTPWGPCAPCTPCTPCAHPPLSLFGRCACITVSQSSFLRPRSPLLPSNPRLSLPSRSRISNLTPRCRPGLRPSDRRAPSCPSWGSWVALAVSLYVRRADQSSRFKILQDRPDRHTLKVRVSLPTLSLRPSASDASALHTLRRASHTSTAHRVDATRASDGFPVIGVASLIDSACATPDRTPLAARLHSRPPSPSVMSAERGARRTFRGADACWPNGASRRHTWRLAGRSPGRPRPLDECQPGAARSSQSV